MNQTYHRAAEANAAAAAAPTKATPEERQRQMANRQAAQRGFWADVQREELEASRSDWRPLFSYTGNLSRIGRHWLGADKSWERVAQTVPPDERDRFLLESRGPQYPWYWSAAVLFGLLGISVCVLNYRVKSLDRLK